MNKQEAVERSQFIFIGSITLAGVCATILAVFQALDTGIGTIADEVLSIDILLFLFCSFFSFWNMKYPKNIKMANMVDNIFFLAVTIITVTGILLIV